MPSLKAIRSRISSVKSTQKITRAMKMVAGARLARAQQRITALRPYAVKTGEVLRHVSGSMTAAAEAEGTIETALHPLLVTRPEKKVLFLVLSSDKGFCGAFNSNITRAAEREWREKKAAGIEVEFATLGRKGRDFLTRKGATVANDFAQIYDGLDLTKATVVTQWLIPRYLRGDWDAIYIHFSEFKSAISQKPVFERMLPLPASEEAQQDKGATTEYSYEPDQKALLERLVPMYFEISIFRALLESQASEFGARMTAMDAATRNAKEMISKLTLVYNRARQAAITKELMEIIGGAEALKE